MRKVAPFLACCLLLMGAARRRVTAPAPAPPTIDIMRSMVIVDPNILQAFDFQRVMQALVSRSGATTTTPLGLYQQWFDTQNPKPGLAVADAPHCDDFLTDGKPSFNGFQRRCPTSEGVLATTDPFAGNHYTAIGITNRFDLTPVDGSNCGQYRIIFNKNPLGQTPLKLHIIFEAVLPNPYPSLGTAGCRAAAEFWADLSTVSSVTERRARIEQFFFDGVAGYEPVLMASHFTAESGGRIRTSQLSPISPDPRFYQFHLKRDGARLLVVPGLLGDMPYSQLYNATLSDPRGAEFRQLLISQVATLARRGDFNAFFDDIPDKFLMHESNSRDDFRTWDLSDGTTPVQNTPEEKAFKDAIATELHRIGSDLTANNLLTRNGLLSCHGCHFGGSPFQLGNGVAFPTAFPNNTHIDEGMANGQFQISPGLRNGFAPARAKILTDFLLGNPMPVHSSGTLGGWRASD